MKISAIHIDVYMSTLKGPQDGVYTSEEDCDLCLCESELGSEACVWRTFIGFGGRMMITIS